MNHISFISSLASSFVFDCYFMVGEYGQLISEGIFERLMYYLKYILKMKPKGHRSRVLGRLHNKDYKRIVLSSFYISIIFYGI